jgi:hypothetical protein
MKPEAQWFFCVFVFSVARESPAALQTNDHKHDYHSDT